MSMFDEAIEAMAVRMGARRPRGSEGAFGPPRPAAQTLADRTTSAAREIIAADADAREERTTRLRAQRLARDAAAEAAPAPAPKTRRRTPKPAR